MHHSCCVQKWVCHQILFSVDEVKCRQGHLCFSLFKAANHDRKPTKRSPFQLKLRRCSSLQGDTG